MRNGTEMIRHVSWYNLFHIPFHTFSIFIGRNKGSVPYPMEQEGARCSPDTQGFDAHPYGLIHDERTETPHPHFVSAKRKTLCQDTYEDKVPGTRFQDMTSLLVGVQWSVWNVTLRKVQSYHDKYHQTAGVSTGHGTHTWVNQRNGSVIPKPKCLIHHH